MSNFDYAYTCPEIDDVIKSCLATVESELDECRNINERMRDAAEEQISELMEQLSSVEEDLSEAQSLNEDLTNQIAELEKELAEVNHA